MKTKICSKCKKTQPCDAFHKCSSTKDKLASKCKTCAKIDNEKNYYKHRQSRLDYRDRYYYENQTVLQQKQRQWANANKEKVKEINKNNYEKNKEARIAYATEYSRNNRAEVNSTKNAYDKKRCDSDPIYKLSRNLRKRLKMALNNKSKKGSAVRDLGIPVDVLLIYLNLDCLDKYGIPYTGNESLFHIDHIKPLASFDLTDRNQLLIACNWSNLQVLTVKENLSKGAKTQ